MQSPVYLFNVRILGEAHCKVMILHFFCTGCSNQNYLLLYNLKQEWGVLSVFIYHLDRVIFLVGHPCFWGISVSALRMAFQNNPICLIVPLMIKNS